MTTPKRYNVVIKYQEEPKSSSQEVYALDEEQAQLFAIKKFLDERRDNPVPISSTVKHMELIK